MSTQAKAFLFILLHLVTQQMAVGNLYREVQHALVFVQAGSANGSGFVASIEGKPYILTNEHILRGGQPLVAQLVDGQPLKLTSLEVAHDRDLVRIGIEHEGIEPLRICTESRIIGDAVWIYGNSDGGGVITSTEGNIVGFGPNLVEVDAEFVRGNSGSPIIASDGRVVGIATYATRFRDPDDWIKEGTRYTEVRRFGHRLNADKWTTISFEDYFIRSNALAAIEQFCVDLFNLRYTRRHKDEHTNLYTYRYISHRDNYHEFSWMCKMLEDATITHNERARNLANIHAQQRTNVSGMGTATSRARIARMQDPEKARQHSRTYVRAYEEVLRFTRSQDWATKRFHDDAKTLYRLLERIVED